MYTILVTEDNELTTTVKERIMQRSKLVDNLHFLADQTYKDIDMSEYDVTLEYVLPVSKEYYSETLTLSDELYKDYLEYTLPFDTSLTKEAGAVELQLTFTGVGLDADGNSTQYVRKTSATTINIVPIAAWSDIVPDSALTAIDQRIIKLQALMNALEDLQDTIINTKADDLSYVDNILQLLANGNKIGSAVEISEGNGDCTCGDGEGLDVTLF